jgi:hypothetical protein
MLQREVRSVDNVYQKLVQAQLRTVVVGVWAKHAEDWRRGQGARLVTGRLVTGACSTAASRNPMPVCPLWN